MVKEAKTDIEKQKVVDYLTEKNLLPATNLLFYTEDENGNITGAYGIEAKICIEPLIADNKFISNKLWNDALATARTLGIDRVSLLTANSKVSDHLINNENGLLWGENLKEIIIQIKK